MRVLRPRCWYPDFADPELIFVSVEHFTDSFLLRKISRRRLRPASATRNSDKKTTTMKLNLILNRFSVTVGAILAASSVSSQAQNVLVNATLSDVPGAGGVFDYTLTLQNTGSEAIESLWVGWVPGVFDVNSPTAVGNNLGWTSSPDGPSIQYGGTAATAIAPGATGVFTFDSTSTPAQFVSHAAGDSTAYGVNAANGQLSFTLSPPDTETFNPTVVPEPSTFGLVAVSSLGLLGTLRRKFRR